MSTASQQRKPGKTTRTEWVERWCDLVGLQAHFVRFVAQKAGYLAEDQHWQRMPIKVPLLAASNAPSTPSPPSPTTALEDLFMLDFNTVPPVIRPASGGFDQQRGAIRAELFSRLESVL